jgi:hypothetical protein
MNLVKAMSDHVSSPSTKFYFVVPNRQLWYGYVLLNDMDR